MCVNVFVGVCMGVYTQTQCTCVRDWEERIVDALCP